MHFRVRAYLFRARENWGNFNTILGGRKQVYKLYVGITPRYINNKHYTIQYSTLDDTICGIGMVKRRESALYYQLLNSYYNIYLI